MSRIQCRTGCGACCVAPSISSPIPDAPSGKPAGVRCPHLNDLLLCMIYHHPERPSVCISFQASRENCGNTREEALQLLAELEKLTHGPKAAGFPAVSDGKQAVASD